MRRLQGVVLLAQGHHGFNPWNHRKGGRNHRGQHRVVHRSIVRKRPRYIYRARQHARIVPHLLTRLRTLHWHPLHAKKHQHRPHVDTDRDSIA